MPSWHQSLIDAFREPEELAQYLKIELPNPSPETGPEANFPMLVPRGFAARMEKGNPRDPLLLQVLPVAEETYAKQGYCQDPVGEAAATIAPGVLHKYRGRVLLVSTGACSLHCRYCFRRHFPYTASVAGGINLDPAIRYLKSNKEITEVILSGGDPLMLTNSALQDMLHRLETVEHLTRLRIHSRMPLTLPERVDPELTQLLATSRLKVVLVLHCNHANELCQEVRPAIDLFSASGITILNQSVLLRGINDSVEALHLLSEKLFSYGILPYYLHMLDRVTGAMHFEIGIDRAISMHKQLQGKLPGYLVPKLVYEKPGAASKLLLL